jgi:hypothetical protein
MSKWMFARRYIDSIWWLEHRLRAKPLADRTNANYLIRMIDVAVAFHDSGFYPPWQELRIAFNVGDEVE